MKILGPKEAMSKFIAWEISSPEGVLCRDYEDFLSQFSKSESWLSSLREEIEEYVVQGYDDMDLAMDDLARYGLELKS